MFDDVCVCNLPGPALSAIGGGSGMADERPKGKGGGRFGAGGILLLPLRLPGSGGGGGPKMLTLR